MVLRVLQRPPPQPLRPAFRGGSRRAALGGYETSGDLTIPLVTLHTTGDEVIPVWHELLYAAKADLSGRGRFLPAVDQP